VVAYLRHEHIEYDDDASPVYLMGLARRRVKRKIMEDSSTEERNLIGNGMAALDVVSLVKKIDNLRLAASEHKSWEYYNAKITHVPFDVVKHVHYADWNGPCKGMIGDNGVCSKCDMSVPGEYVYLFSIIIEDLVRPNCDIKIQVNDKGGRAMFGVSAAVFAGEPPETQREKIESVQEVPALLKLFIQYQMHKDGCTPSLTEFVLRPATFDVGSTSTAIV